MGLKQNPTLCFDTAGERRPGTVGLPLPGVSVKVAPLSDDAEDAKQDSADYHEGSVASTVVCMLQA